MRVRFNLLLVLIPLAEIACGKYVVDLPVNRIINGRPAVQGEVPFQLFLRTKDFPICGGVLVEVNGYQVGLTAAHCAVNFGSSVFVIAGDLSLNDTSGFEQVLPVENIFRHENYNSLTFENDIALIFTNASFVLTENVKPVKLPSAGQEFSGKLTMSGWGYIQDPINGGSVPDQLQIVESPVFNRSLCKAIYDEIDYFARITEDMICVTRPEGPCNGDSGGPGVSEDGFLAGIVSWSKGCEDIRFPSVFTKVSSYVTWIQKSVDYYRESF